MEFSLRREDDVPLYQQIVNQIRDAIWSGALPAGYRLPPIREIAARHGVTRLTVHSAYEELQARGLVESYVGRGTFVAAEAATQAGPRRAAEAPAQWVSEGVLGELLRMSELDVISFAQAFPAPESYPRRELGRALEHAAARLDEWGYGSIQGEADLREQIAALLLDRGLAIAPEHMLITSGAQQGIDLALRALVEPGDVILVEEPTYPGVLDLAARRGQRVVGVPGDERGLRIDALAAACQAHQPRLLYLVPTFGNPTGVSLATERREAVLRLAQVNRMVVVEDDAYGFLGYDRPVPPPLKSEDPDGQTVVLITSFSKMLAPALRLGAMMAPPSMLPALAAAKQSSDLVCSTLLQHALAEYLRSGAMAGHLRQSCALYRERRDAMLAALQRHLPACSWTEPAGGLSLWLTLPPGVVERDFADDAIKAGVGIASGRAFHPQQQGQAHMRLSFGMHPPERIEEGMAALGGVLQSHLHRRLRMLSLAGRTVGPLV